MLIARMTVATDIADHARSSRETSRLFHEAEAWMDAKSACVCRTPLGSGEHVAVVLPSGISAQFVADDPSDYEQGIVLAVDELRWPASGTHALDPGRSSLRR